MISYYLQVTVTFISLSSDFALYLWPYLLERRHRSLKQKVGSTSCPWTTILLDIFSHNVLAQIYKNSNAVLSFNWWCISPYDSFIETVQAQLFKTNDVVS